MKYTFRKHKFPYLADYIQSFRIAEPEIPSEWMESNFILSSSYAAPGPLKLFPWQIDIVNSIRYFDFILLVAAVQTGKSLIVEMITAYMIATTVHNMLFIYSKKEVIEDVFDERLVPMVKEVEAVRKYWAGDERALTKKRIKLMHLVIRIASAGLKSDIATHNAGVVLGDELAKWPVKDFSQLKAIEGRKQASRMMGRQTKTILCTSPDNDQDPSYIEAHKPGTIILEPNYQCPHCKTWQVFIDSQVKERPNKRKQKDHDIERIRRENAAYYECIKCKKEITEMQRLEAAFNVKWMSENKIPYEKLIKDPNRPRRVVFKWSRFVDTTWTFVDCLIAFFSAYQSPNPLEHKTYQNEDLAKWVKLYAKKVKDDLLQGKKKKYFMYGDNASVPADVLFLMIGIDTQDKGFYYVVRGYGMNFESWLIRCDWIECDMNDKNYQNPVKVYECVYNEITRHPYKKKDGKSVPFLAGIIDEGGHRKADVDTICDHWPEMNSYKGSSFKTIQLVERKESGLVQGNTENLSRIVGKQMESNFWHLPIDVPKPYLKQVVNEYDEEITDARGNKKTKWTQKDPNHYRSCENYLIGMANILELGKILSDDKKVKELLSALKDIETIKTTEKTIENDFQGEDYRSMISDFDRQLKNIGF